MKTRVLVVLTVVIAVGIALLMQDNKASEQGNHVNQQEEGAAQDLGEETRNIEQEEGLQTGEESVANKDPQLGVPLFFQGTPVKLEDLSETEQLAVRFMKEFIETKKGETKDEYFKRLRPYMDPLMPDVTGDEYLPAFKENRKLDKIYVAGTYERKNSYIVFVRVAYENKELDVPLLIEKGSNYVLGYSEHNRGKITEIEIENKN